MKVWAEMDNYILLFYMNTIIYPSPNPDAGLAKLCQ